jgi:hypothetical protein
LIIEPPSFTPSPYGLLTVAQLLDPPTPHWQNGLTWESRCMDPGMGSSTYDECIAVTGVGSIPEPSQKTPNTHQVLRGATPFTPFTRFDCSPVGLPDAAAMARDALAQSEAWQVERAFWTGLVDGKLIAFPHLAANDDVFDAQGAELQSAATVVTSGTAVDLATGLGLLEEGLGNCYNGRGVVHVPVRVLPTLDMHGIVRVVGDHLETLKGNLLSVGAGYPGTSPTGANAAAGEAWIYATGAVFFLRGEVRILPTTPASFDRSTNTIQQIAERTYVLGWDCCHVAAQVRIGVPVT